MKSKTFFKNSKKAITVIAGLSLLLAFSQCKKDTEKDKNFEVACDASEYINDNLQSQLDLLNDKTTPEAMATLAEWIKGQEGVASAEASDDQVAYVYVDGTKGLIMVYDQTITSDRDFDRDAVMPARSRKSGSAVGNQKGFIYDAFPYLDRDFFPGDNSQRLFEENGYECVHLKEEDCTIDALNDMFCYGYVQFVTHGGQVVSAAGENMDVFATGEKVTRKKRELYRESMENDLIVEGNLTIKKGLFGYEHKGDFFGVTNKFVEGLQGHFDNTIVFMGACDGYNENAPLLTDAFLGHGIGTTTYFGFNNTVYADYICLTTESILLDLFHGVAIGAAYNNVCSNDDIGRCYEYIDEDSGEVALMTCLDIAGRLDIVWYEDPNAPTVTTHKVPSSNVGSTTATVTGSVVFPNPQPIEYERGFIYYTLPDGSDAQQEVYPGSELLNFSCTLTGLSSNTTYFVMAYSRWEGNRTILGKVEKFKTLSNDGTCPTGAINGLFSVSESQQVYFSKGNLQYIGSAATPYWKFAENQWDVLGDNGQGSADQNVDRDLFGWGTSGWNNGNIYYQPWDTEYGNYFSNGQGYGPTDGTNYSFSLTGSYANADWGVYNPISNGGNQPNQWRTMTKEEWEYVLFTRSTTSGIRFAKAEVNGMKGVILLPDDWSASFYSLNNTNISDAVCSSNTLTALQWNYLEQHGAVFFPAAGDRYSVLGTIVAVGRGGNYWSASCDNNAYAYYVYFYDSGVGHTEIYPPMNCVRIYGYSVRLVTNAGN